MNKNIVIHHSADYDGLFCREIARKFLSPDIEFIGWDFADAPLDKALLTRNPLYIIDLPVDKPFGLEFKNGWIYEAGLERQPLDRWDSSNIIWIDHHKSSIQSHPSSIPGYRIDGVAACRLAWQWFSLHAEWDPREQQPPYQLPKLEDYLERKVTEPLAVRLAGEYDIWDKRDPRAEWFQFGLDGVDEIDWKNLLDLNFQGQLVGPMCMDGCRAQRVISKRDADMMKSRSFKTKFEGMTFLALNIARCNSLTFASLDKPETGHDGLMGFYWNGKTWTVSLYHAKHNTGIDLSEIAKKYGGGGHRGACGFRVGESTFINAFIKCS